MAEKEKKPVVEDENKKFSRQLLGKIIVSKTGKRFGEVGDIIFETKSGELIHMVVNNPTPYTEKLELEKDKQGRILIPFSAVIAMGDFMVIAEEDII
jgi:sporulation protein YlmC with PRC-barrel domain